MTNFLSEDLAVVGVIDPDANVAGTYLTNAIDMSKFEEVIFIVMAGDLGTNATVAFSVKSSATAGGSYAALSPAVALTTLTDAGSDSNKQAIVRVRPAQLADGKQFIKGEMVVAVATSDCGVIALAGAARSGPANKDDLATVDEIVN